MPKVDFYIIKQSSEADALFFACRLSEKVYKQGLKIYLHTESETAAQALDDLLWSFRPESFLPHMISSGDHTEDDEEVRIIIGYTDSYSGPKEVLINLSTKLPSFHGEFQRIAEIVRNDETSKQISREHWSTYKKMGYELKMTDV